MRPDLQKLSSISMNGLGGALVSSPKTATVPEETVRDDVTNQEIDLRLSETKRLSHMTSEPLTQQGSQDNVQKDADDAQLNANSTDGRVSITSLNDGQLFGEFTFLNVDVLGDVSRDVVGKRNAVDSDVKDEKRAEDSNGEEAIETAISNIESQDSQPHAQVCPTSSREFIALPHSRKGSETCNLPHSRKGSQTPPMTPPPSKSQRHSSLFKQIVWTSSLKGSNESLTTPTYNDHASASSSGSYILAPAGLGGKATSKDFTSMLGLSRASMIVSRKSSSVRLVTASRATSSSGDLVTTDSPPL